MTTPQEVTFEEWNEQPNQFKASFKFNNDPLLQAIEDNPIAYSYFDDGTVQNHYGEVVIETTDYENDSFVPKK